MILKNIFKLSLLILVAYGCWYVVILIQPHLELEAKQHNHGMMLIYIWGLMLDALISALLMNEIGKRI